MDVTAQGGISVREEDNSQTIASNQWSQTQQKALEGALASVPKTNPDRWGDIAALVPDKSKVSATSTMRDCLL